MTADDTIAPIAVLGGRGMLATAFSHALARDDTDVTALGINELDITDPDAVAGLPRRVRTVVNCAAWTDVDAAETDEPAATRVNAAAVAHLARRCADTGATLVHFSTDYVFDGRATAPYTEDDPANPANAYGRSKLAGEHALAASPCDHLLIRTSWLYAPWGNNFVLTMRRLIRERDEVRVVDDQRGRPTSASQLADRTIALLRAGARGIFHLTDAGHCTWFELARHTALCIGEPIEKVRPCTTADMPRPAARPPYAVLDNAKAEARIGPAAHWRDAVRGTLEHATTERTA